MLHKSKDLLLEERVFVGSHGPAGQMIKYIVARENGLCGEYELPGRDFTGGKFHDMEVMPIGSFDFSLDLIENYYRENNIARINHGGLWEAAYHYAVNPDYYIWMRPNIPSITAL